MEEEIMTTLTRSARGASAYTYAEDDQWAELCEPSPVASEEQCRPEHQWPVVIDDLLRLQGLSDDWDGQGALAPDPTVVHQAIKLARAFEARGFPPADRAIAGLNGTVFLEWRDAPGNPGYFEVEVLSANEIEGRRFQEGAGRATVLRFPSRF
jgi:hypothetical protein